MGVIITMTEKVKCYNIKRITELLNKSTNPAASLKEYMKLREYSETFQPPYCRFTSGPVKRPEWYIRATPEVDAFMKGHNLWAVLRGIRPVKPGYKKYDKVKAAMDSFWEESD